jgi:hypothetical protein
MAEQTLAPELIQSIKDQVFDKGTNGVSNPYVAPSVPVATDDQPAAPAVTASNEPAAAPIASPVAPVPAVDYNTYIRETFGYDSVEVAKAEIERLKNTPPVIKELDFPDEIAKKMYLNIKEGKYDEVANFIQGNRLLKDFDIKTPEEQLKLYIRMQNPRFDETDVSEEFKDTYYLDEENIAPEKLARERKKMEQRKENDVLKAREFFQQYKSQINLPDITPPVPQVNAEFEEFQRIVNEEMQRDQKLAEVLSKVPEAEATYTYKFADEKSKIAFDLSYAPTAEDFEKAKRATLDWNTFLKENYYNADGSPQTSKWLKHQVIMQDIDGYTVEISKQAINATIKWFLANQKNIGDGVQRNYNAVVPTEVDKLKEQVFGK